MLILQSSREKLKIHTWRGKGPFYHLAHHHSPHQTLDVLQVAGVPRKTYCPELSLGSRQSLIRTVSRGSISSRDLNTLSLFNRAQNFWYNFNGHITLFRDMKLMLTIIFTLIAVNTTIHQLGLYSFYILKSKFIPVNFHGVVMRPAFNLFKILLEIILNP